MRMTLQKIIGTVLYIFLFEGIGIQWLVGWAMMTGVIVTISGEGAVAWGANSCVECHKKAAGDNASQILYQNQFIHWYGSVHGKKGVTCEKCHGGDPARTDKKQAHRGVKSSRDPKSAIYYKNLPETCGSCHKGVYQQFVQSRHYKNLKAERLAPTCTTCHGFEMDIGAVKPLQLMGRCSNCHNPQRGVRPEVADLTRQVLEAISRAEQAIQRAQTVVDLAREEGLEPKAAEELLSTARGRLEKTRELWHTFHLEAFRQELMEVQGLAGKSYTAAKQAILRK